MGYQRTLVVVGGAYLSILTGCFSLAQFNNAANTKAASSSCLVNIDQVRSQVALSPQSLYIALCTLRSLVLSQ